RAPLPLGQWARVPRARLLRTDPVDLAKRLCATVLCRADYPASAVENQGAVRIAAIGAAGLGTKTVQALERAASDFEYCSEIVVSAAPGRAENVSGRIERHCGGGLRAVRAVRFRTKIVEYGVSACRRELEHYAVVLRTSEIGCAV